MNTGIQRSSATLPAQRLLLAEGDMLREDFDGDGAVQAGIGGAIHLSHTTGTDLVGDFVWA